MVISSIYWFNVISSPVEYYHVINESRVLFVELGAALVVVTVPFQTIRVAKKKVVKYIKHKEKERKHSREQGMEDVSARKSCKNRRSSFQTPCHVILFIS